jgi:hypothetical protein
MRGGEDGQQRGVLGPIFMIILVLLCLQLVLVGIEMPFVVLILLLGQLVVFIRGREVCRRMSSLSSFMPCSCGGGLVVGGERGGFLVLLHAFSILPGTKQGRPHVCRAENLCVIWIYNPLANPTSSSPPPNQPTRENKRNERSWKREREAPKFKVHALLFTRAEQGSC